MLQNYLDSDDRSAAPRSLWTASERDLQNGRPRLRPSRDERQELFV